MGHVFKFGDFFFQTGVTFLQHPALNEDFLSLYCSTSCNFLLSGIISGALLQLRIHFQLSCSQQEMVVTSLIIGGLLASIVGGITVLSISVFFKVYYIDLSLYHSVMVYTEILLITYGGFLGLLFFLTEKLNCHRGIP